MEEEGAQSSPQGNTHTVSKGETLSGIAKAHGTSVKALRILNPSLPEDPRKLGIGTKLFLKISIDNFFVQAQDATFVAAAPMPILKQNPTVPQVYNNPWPVDTIFQGRNIAISSGMYRKHGGKYHGAADLSYRGLSGARVFATHAGEVTLSKQNNPSAGNYVVIQAKEGFTRYLHMRDKPLVNVGQQVEAGEQIGFLGNTGTVNPHLHYEIGVGVYDIRKNPDPSQRRNPIVGQPRTVVDGDPRNRLRSPQEVFEKQ
jgi:murein DD-endopeptidase MepM/ murein hydrolase activator NlpD